MLHSVSEKLHLVERNKRGRGGQIEISNATKETRLIFHPLCCKTCMHAKESVELERLLGSKQASSPMSPLERTPGLPGQICQVHFGANSFLRWPKRHGSPTPITIRGTDQAKNNFLYLATLLNTLWRRKRRVGWSQPTRKNIGRRCRWPGYCRLHFPSRSIRQPSPQHI